MRKIILLLMPFVFMACSSALDGLKKDDKEEKKLIINYESSGCFHFYRKIYKFENDRVTIHENDTNIGTVEVTNEELANLDKLFQFYENNSYLGRCTTHVNIDYRLYKEDKLIKSKSYRHNSCSNPKDKNITTLYYFDEKIAQQKEDERFREKSKSLFLKFLRKGEKLIEIGELKKYYKNNEKISSFTIDTKGKKGYLYILSVDERAIYMLQPNEFSALIEIKGKYTFPKDFTKFISAIEAFKSCGKCKEEKTTVYVFLTEMPIVERSELLKSDNLIGIGREIIIVE